MYKNRKITVIILINDDYCYNIGDFYGELCNVSENTITDMRYNASFNSFEVHYGDGEMQSIPYHAVLAVTYSKEEVSNG